MRFAGLASIALALTSGCLRFGYGPDTGLLDAGFDAGSFHDGGHDADGGKLPLPMDGGNMDAAHGGDADGANVAPDAAVLDASSGVDTGVTDPTGSDASMSDSGMTDSGAIDSGVQDAGAVDSSLPDPGTTDPVDPAWTADCPDEPGVLFCDGFENGLGMWGHLHMRGSTAVSMDFERTGSYSMRASTSASTSNEQSQARRSVQVFGHRKSGELWARFYYYLPSSVVLTRKVSISVISEAEPPWLGFSVLITPTGLGLESLATERTISLTQFPRDQWVCVEMHVLVAPPSEGVFEYFLNGARIIGANMNTIPNQGYTNFELGVHYADYNQGSVTAYSDDVKLGTRRIGCD